MKTDGVKMKDIPVNSQERGGNVVHNTAFGGQNKKWCPMSDAGRTNQPHKDRNVSIVR